MDKAVVDPGEWWFWVFLPIMLPLAILEWIIDAF